MLQWITQSQVAERSCFICFSWWKNPSEGRQKKGRYNSACHVQAVWSQSHKLGVREHGPSGYYMQGNISSCKENKFVSAGEKLVVESERTRDWWLSDCVSGTWGESVETSLQSLFRTAKINTTTETILVPRKKQQWFLSVMEHNTVWGQLRQRWADWGAEMVVNASSWNSRQNSFCIQTSDVFCFVVYGPEIFFLVQDKEKIQ